MPSSSDPASRNRLVKALGALRALGVPFRGPFITPKKSRIYVVDQCILTEDEIVVLHESHKLKPQTVWPLLKDLRLRQTVVVEPPTAELNSQDRRRGERVMLRLDVLVRTEIPGAKHLQTHAFTVAVNAYGGRLVSPFRMAMDQRIVLVNPRNGKEVTGRVVRVERNAEGGHVIAFAFDDMNAAFWPVCLTEWVETSH